MQRRYIQHQEPRGKSFSAKGFASRYGRPPFFRGVAREKSVARYANDAGNFVLVVPSVANLKNRTRPRNRFAGVGSSHSLPKKQSEDASPTTALPAANGMPPRCISPQACRTMLRKEEGALSPVRATPRNHALRLPCTQSEFLEPLCCPKN